MKQQYTSSSFVIALRAVKQAPKLLFSFSLAVLLSANVADAQPGTITTFAGNGIEGYLGDGGPAIAARLQSPAGTVIDAWGNMYIADFGNNRIRMVSLSTGLITTVAGTGIAGYSGDGGQATAAELQSPIGLALDASGNIYFADESNNRIRMITVSTGIITTVAGTGYGAPSSGAFSGDGGPATAATFYFPSGVAFDAAGDLYICDWINNRIREVNVSTGIITTIAGTGAIGYTGDGGPAAAATFYKPESIAFDATGNLYVAEYGNSTVRKIAALTGTITTIAGTGVAGYSGDGGPGTAAELSQPLGVTTDAGGNVYIADWMGSNRVRVVSALTGMINTIAGDGVVGYGGDGGQATVAELGGGTDGVTIDASGNLYISDEFNGSIREVSCAICVLSVPDASDSHIAEIYPNPATRSITISGVENIFPVSITNLTGQTVYSHSCNTDKVQVDISNLPSGMYLVRINGSQVRKFVKE